MAKFYQRERNDTPDILKKNNNLNRIISITQHRWADRLNYWTSGVSQKTKIIGLIVFCLLGLGFTLFPLYTLVKSKESLAFNVGTIPKPRLLPAEPKMQVTSEQQFQKIKILKAYLDSLYRSPEGKKHRDSLLKGHMGLMDSIIMIEEIYRIENNKGKQNTQSSLNKE